MSPEVTVLACVALPLLAPALIAALRRWPNPREAVTLLTSGCLFLLVYSLHDDVLQGARPACEFPVGRDFGVLDRLHAQPP